MAKADAYKTFLRNMARPDYGEAEGNRGWMLLTRSAAETMDFMFVSLWDSLQAIAQYTGGDPERPKYYAEDRAALLELPDRVEHFVCTSGLIDEAQPQHLQNRVRGIISRRARLVWVFRPRNPPAIGLWTSSRASFPRAKRKVPEVRL
jgi:hypothetical protein